MNRLSLQKSAVLSAALHLTALFMTFIFIRQSSTLIIPSPYIVDLVSPDIARHEADSLSAAAIPKVPDDGLKKTAKPVVTPNKSNAEIKKADKNDQKRVEERISELSAKKKIERILNLRSVISLKGKGDQDKQNASSQHINAGSSSRRLAENYYGKITNEIRKEWIYPDTGENQLEAIVFVRILKDGTIQVKGIEKSSGKVLFDRSALKALAKASPVSPPPYEMEIGIRFYP